MGGEGGLPTLPLGGRWGIQRSVHQWYSPIMCAKSVMKLQLKKMHSFAIIMGFVRTYCRWTCRAQAVASCWNAASKRATCVAVTATTSLTQPLIYQQDVKLINRHQQFRHPLISLLPIAINCGTKLLRLKSVWHEFAIKLGLIVAWI